MTARTRCVWVKFGECGELLCERKFPLRLVLLFTRVM